MDEEDDAAKIIGARRAESEEEEVELDPDLLVFWTAWHVLRFDRHYGAFGGQTPILFTAIDVYATRFGIDGEDFDTLLKMLHAMDAEYMIWLEEERKKKDQTPDNSEEPRPTPI